MTMLMISMRLMTLITRLKMHLLPILLMADNTMQVQKLCFVENLE